MAKHRRTTTRGSVPVKVTVVGIDDAVIQNAKVAVFLTSDRTEVLNTETDESGIARTTYAGSTPAEVEVRCRKAAAKDSPRYVNYSCVQTIKADTGLDIDVILIKDRNFNKIS
ncbi:MAG: hypothetical protein ABII90_05390 [Bacteroidota bacterium]